MFCLHNAGSVLKKNQDFKKVYSRGLYVANHLFVAYALANDLNQTRIGITVSKKVGGAVVRNRVKRLVKEYIRQRPKQENNTNKFFDIVIVARAPAGVLPKDTAFLNVCEAMDNVTKRLEKKL